MRSDGVLSGGAPHLLVAKPTLRTPRSSWPQPWGQALRPEHLFREQAQAQPIPMGLRHAVTDNDPTRKTIPEQRLIHQKRSPRWLHTRGTGHERDKSIVTNRPVGAECLRCNASNLVSRILSEQSVIVALVGELTHKIQAHTVTQARLKAELAELNHTCGRRSTVPPGQ